MIYRFGEFELDEERCQIRRGCDPVPIQPKAFDVLLYLVRARDRVVSKAELLDRVWPDTVVGEHSVVRAVNALRTALGDRGLPRGIVRSVARKGYRFVAELFETTPPAPAAMQVRDAPSAPGEEAPRPDPYVGREALLQALADELGRAIAGETRTLLLEGEAGIGKTRTAEELALRAHERGVHVCSGWCPENEAAAPFHPWLQILGGLSRSPGWRRIRRTRPAAASDVEALLRGSAGAPGAGAAPRDVRFRLFESVAVVLRAAAEDEPLLLVVDDLHAADASSLRLLEFVAREITDAPIALLLALRTDEVDPRHPIVPTLAELARRRTRRFPLAGLTREEIARCLAAWGTGAAPDALLDEVARRSEGNPFYVRELSLWLSGEAPTVRAGVPPSIRDVVRRRLQPLSTRCTTVLHLAAVIGREFELEVLLGAVPLAREEALAALEEALAAHVLAEHPSASRLRFAHGLIQECLLEDQNALQRARLHRAVAAALAALDGDGEERLPERAHHACEGADAATAEAAVAAALRAGERAMAMTAFEESARLYGRALGALALSPARTPARRCAILFDRARAQAHAGDAAGAERSYEDAERIASELGDAPRVARAAIGRLGSLPALAPPALERIRALEAATASLGPDDTALRITALSRLGLAWSATGERSRGIRRAEAALQAARTLGEPRILAGTLALRAALFDPREPPSTRLARVGEALALLARSPAPRIELECRIQRAAALLELGRIEELDAEITGYGTIAARLNERTPFWYVGVQTALRKLMAGELAAAEREILHAHAAGRRAGHPDAGAYLAIQLTQLRYFQGRLAEMEAPLRSAAEAAPSLAGLRAALALVLAETGRTKEARRKLDALAREDFVAVPRDAGWLSNLSLLALVAARVRDPGHAASLEEKLAPFRERNVCAFVVASNGSLQHFLGLLAATRGDRERARAALECAVGENHARQIAPWAAASEYELSVLLAAEGEADLQRAHELAGRALATAERLGMAPLATASRRTRLEIEQRLHARRPAATRNRPRRTPPGDASVSAR